MIALPTEPSIDNRGRDSEQDPREQSPLLLPATDRKFLSGNWKPPRGFLWIEIGKTFLHNLKQY